jgi:hypothetical protein
MSRLLFAAARGARIQTNDRGGWLDAAYIPTADYKGDDFRIHPNDEHLAYGPISTEVRNYALGLPLTGTCWFARLALHSDGDLHALSPNNRYVFLLLVAEALADEGM